MFKLFAAVSTAALLAGTAQAQDAATAVPAPAEPMAATPASPTASSGFSDTQLESFASAMARVRPLAEAAGAQPTAEQQAEMAAVVEGSGLDAETFNAISTAVSSDAALRARLAVLEAPEPAAGSVAAGVTDAEVLQFSTTMARIRALNAGAQPTEAQQAEMAAAVEASGLTTDRFNEISTAVSTDARLRARVQVADAQRAG